MTTIQGKAGTDFDGAWDPEKTADVLIVGGGPAGLTAALYASRARLSTLVLEGGVVGGQAAITDRVDNYPGFPQGVGGAELARMMEEQARRFGAVIISDMAQSVEEKDGLFVVKGYDPVYKARSIIAASGAEYKRLGIPGESELVGRGISFCATCDAPFFRNQKVAVIGGGDSAVKEALFLTKFASEVFVVHRRDALRAEKVIQEEAMANPKIKFIWDTVPLSVKGDNGVSAVELKGVKDGSVCDLDVSGVFVFIGTRPRSDYLKGLVTMDEWGNVITNDAMETSRRGIFAAGDVRQKTLRQVATAVGDGATAAFSAEKYLETLKQ
ncbi:MAG: thioredoxin-disulfide reductase [Deltaproteobacteria bacterium]|nr:thioredoxin-disulfide reductase [Deltaproteobacteria bacterium]